MEAPRSSNVPADSRRNLGDRNFSTWNNSVRRTLTALGEPLNLIRMPAIDPDQHKTELRPVTVGDDPQQRLIYLAPADVGGHLGRPDGHFRCAVPVARRASHDG